MSNIFSTVPLFKGLRLEGSTFYTFSGATNDTTLLFSTDNIRMNFSKFVCLRLPEWSNVAKQRLYKNPIDLESINDSSAVDNANTFFTKAYLQNYLENFTSIVDANRDDLTFSNFSEAGFWKSLLSVSKPTPTSTNNYQTLQLEVDSTYEDVDLVTHEKYREINNVDNSYEQIVQYVGDINMLNHVKSAGKEYLEVFGHIPTSAGKVNDVLWKKNDGLTVNLAQVPSTSGTAWISGQQNNYENAQASAKTYAQAVYDTVDRKYNVNTDQDMLQIDWDDIESQLAKETKYDNGNFEFNAVLLYYDVFDKNNMATRKRNLYGILVMDKFTTASPTSQTIDRFKKYQPNENQSGNAFGFRFNLQFSNSTNQLTSEITINDYSTMSMELYMAALERIQLISDQYSKMTSQMLQYSIEHNQMRQIILSLQSQNT